MEIFIAASDKLIAVHCIALLTLAEGLESSIRCDHEKLSESFPAALSSHNAFRFFVADFQEKTVFLYNFTVASSLAVACYMREWRWIRFVRSAIEEVTRIKFKYFSLSKAADKNGRKTPTSNKVFYIVFYQIFATHLYSMRRKTRALQAIKTKKNCDIKIFRLGKIKKK